MEWFNSLENHPSRFSDNRSTPFMQSNSFGALVPTNSEKELVKESANAFLASSIVSDLFPSGFKVDVDMPAFFAKLAILKGSQELLFKFLANCEHASLGDLIFSASIVVQYARVSLLMISEHKDFKASETKGESLLSKSKTLVLPEPRKPDITSFCLKGLGTFLTLMI